MRFPYQLFRPSRLLRRSLRSGGVKAAATGVASAGVVASAGTLATIAVRITPVPLVAAAQGASGVAAGSAVVATLAAVAAGRRRLAVVAGLCVLLWAAHLLGIYRADRPGHGQGPRLVAVGSANLLFHNDDPERAAASVADTVTVRRLDVLVTAETTPRMVVLLGERLGGSWRPVAETGVVGLRTVVWTHLPVLDVDTLVTSGRKFPVVVLDVNGTRVRVVGVHVTAPHTRGRIAVWGQELDALGSLAEQGHPGEAFSVLAGDFNADLAHPVMRRLNDSTFDAMQASGHILRPTWPSGRLMPPMLTLDHVLVNRPGTVTEAGTFPIAGSDHLGVWAELTVPDGMGAG